MSANLDLVKSYLLDLNLDIIREDEADELVIVANEDSGIKNLIIDCEEPIVVLEQLIMETPNEPGDFYKRLLQMNRGLVHGAFVLDEEAKYVFFRDTLQLENLDKNELEGSIQALSFGLAENAGELLKYAGQE